MFSFDRTLERIKRFRWVTTGLRLLMWSAPLAVAGWTWFHGVADSLPAATITTLTIVAFAGAIVLVNQVGTLLGVARLVTWVEDYRYGLSLGNLFVGFEEDDADACLQIGVFLRNTTPKPMRYLVNRFDVVIGDRVIPAQSHVLSGGIICAGDTTLYRQTSFPRASVSESIGKKVAGSVELDVSYGHPDRPFSRRMKRKLVITLSLAQGKLGASYLTSAEGDEPH